MRLPIGEGDILCLDWDERSLRVIEAGASRGGVKIRSAVRVPMTAAPADPAAVGELIRRTLAEHRIRGRRAIVNVPRQDALLNLLSLPKGTQDELAAMVHIQIAKDLPFAKDQTVIDFAVAPPKDGDTNLDVWVAAVRNSVIDYYRQVVTAAGLRVERIGLRPYSNVAALNAGVEQTGRTLLVDIGPSMTEIDLVRDGRLAYSRSATVGLPEGGPGGEGSSTAMDGLLVEVNRTLAAYRSTDAGAKIDRILLAGTASIDASVIRAFQDRFGAPAQVFDVPPALKWRGGKETSAAPFGSVIGLALASVGENLYSFNLLAPKEPEGERRERIRQVPYKAALIAAFCAVAAIVAYAPLYSRSAQIARLQAAIDSRNQDKPERDELTKLLGDLEAWQKQDVYWIDHLRRIGEVFPSTRDVYLSKVDFKDTGEIVLEVQTTDKFQADDIVDHVNAIREKDSRGREHRLYTAKLGTSTEKANEPVYKITDHVIIQIESMAPTGTVRR